MTAVDCIVINLVRRADRRADIGGRLTGAGIAHRFLPAIDATTTPTDVLSRDFPRPVRSYPPLAGEMACALSHRAAWDAFLAGPGRSLCVLEDDVHFGMGLAGLLADDGWVTPAMGIVKLDLNAHRQSSILASPVDTVLPVNGLTLWRLWSRRLGGGGYIAHRDVVQRLRAALSTMAAPMDHHLFNPAHAPLWSDLGVHVVLPAPVWHDHAGPCPAAQGSADRMGLGADQACARDGKRPRHPGPGDRPPERRTPGHPGQRRGPGMVIRPRRLRP
jgi:glycosyl transferase family 25